MGLTAAELIQLNKLCVIGDVQLLNDFDGTVDMIDFMDLKKIFLILSIVVNFCLGAALFIVWESSGINSREVKRIDQMRINDLRLLEVLLIKRFSKNEVLKILKAKVPEGEYFEKPEENGIGIGSMFLKFDDKSILRSVSSLSQEGP